MLLTISTLIFVYLGVMFGFFCIFFIGKTKNMGVKFSLVMSLLWPLCLIIAVGEKTNELLRRVVKRL